MFWGEEFRSGLRWIVFSSGSLMRFQLQGSKICHPKIFIWYVYYFKLKIIKVQKTQEETLAFPQLPKKIFFDREPVPRTELPSEIFVKYMAWCGGETLKRLKSTLCTIVSAWPRKHLFIKHLLFHLHVNFLPHLWNPKPLLPTPSFVFSWINIHDEGFGHLRELLIFPGSLSCILYTLRNFCVMFSC